LISKLTIFVRNSDAGQPPDDPLPTFMSLRMLTIGFYGTGGEAWGEK
jgi:hypothetical protein